jgi:hypothetical protein
MPSLKGNLKGWRDSARIDWFSHFIKAWIPFNAWMTNTFGDLSDHDMLDQVKAGSNVVYNRVIPMLTWSQAIVKGGAAGWQDSSQDADDFRLRIEQLHTQLQLCIVHGRKGRVSFETVDVGANTHKDELRTKRRTFRVRRDFPVKGQVKIEMSATKTTAGFDLVQNSYDRRELEDNPVFQGLAAEYRSMLLEMHSSVAPRKVISVLAGHNAQSVLRFGSTNFISDPERVFSALVDVTYNLRNALFHGSITPNDQHNDIYEPAYHLVMRFVRCTI